MEFLPELIGAAGLVIVSWFANRVTQQLDVIHKDLHGYSERLTTLETVMRIKCGEAKAV